MVAKKKPAKKPAKMVKMGESKRYSEGYGPWKAEGNPAAGVYSRKKVSDAIRRGKGR